MRNSKTADVVKFNTPYHKKFQKQQQVIFADSTEVRATYLKEYIAYLKKELNKFNLLENPMEISAICTEIMRAKKLQEI
jgi:hypothetical protein